MRAPFRGDLSQYFLKEMPDQGTPIHVALDVRDSTPWRLKGDEFDFRRSFDVLLQQAGYWLEVDRTFPCQGFQIIPCTPINPDEELDEQTHFQPPEAIRILGVLLKTSNSFNVVLSEIFEC